MSVETAGWSDFFFGSTSWLMMYEEPLITVAANLKWRVKWHGSYQNYPFALVVVKRGSLTEPPSFIQQRFLISSHLITHLFYNCVMLYKTSSCYQAAPPDQSLKLFWTTSITFHQECGMWYHLWRINRLFFPFFFVKTWVRPKPTMWVQSLLTRC